MIKSGRGGRFFLDISRAAYIPKNVMDVVNRQLNRAIKMMPAQDVVDLAINGADKVVDMDDANDMALMEAEKQLSELSSTVAGLKQQRAESIKSIRTLNDELERARSK